MSLPLSATAATLLEEVIKNQVCHLNVSQPSSIPYLVDAIVSALLRCDPKTTIRRVDFNSFTLANFNQFCKDHHGLNANSDETLLKFIHKYIVTHNGKKIYFIPSQASKIEEVLKNTFLLVTWTANSHNKEEEIRLLNRVSKLFHAGVFSGVFITSQAEYEENFESITFDYATPSFLEDTISILDAIAGYNSHTYKEIHEVTEMYLEGIKKTPCYRSLSNLREDSQELILYSAKIIHEACQIIRKKIQKNPEFSLKDKVTFYVRYFNDAIKKAETGIS